MISENIVLQSAGSLSVAVLALFMLVLQTLFFFRKPQSTWYAWSAAISFSGLLYSVGIFLEYNTPAGPLNRFSGLLEYTAIICLIHSLYGFTFSYLGIESKRYHPVAGVFHGLILILLWSTHYIVAERFITRDFIGLASPYIEPALGPLGPVFVLYAAIAGVIAIIIWIKHKRTGSKHRITFLAGICFWMLLSINDALASLGFPTLQYLMEYGFLGFAMAVLWVVFNSYLEIAAEEKYRVITEFANDCIMVIQDGKMVFTNPACCDLVGAPLTDSVPRDFFDIMAPEDRKTVLKHYNTFIEGGHTPNTHTVRIWKADGEQRYIEISSSRIQYTNAPAVLNIMRDMTKTKRTEEALRESEQKYRTILQSIEEGYYEIDIAGSFTFFNESFCKILGLTEDKLMGRNFRDFTDQETSKKGYWTFNKVFTTGNPNEGFHWAITRKDGASTFVEASASLKRDAEGEPIGFRGIVRDITKKQRLEAQLQQAQKMEAIATLAGGIAHEFNNALMGIVGYIELLKMDLPEDERSDEYFDVMKRSGHRMSRLTDQLLAYAQGGKYQPKDLKWDAFVIETLPILQHDLGPAVRVETHFQKDISYVKADHAQMQMVLSAILANSNEAIENEGIIRITAENKDIDEDFTKQHPDLKPGYYVCLTIEDDGKGMDEKTRDGMFEPFFTTKFQGRGMGMAAVYGIVINHNGWISVDSELGKITVVRIYLPVVEVEVKKEEKAGIEPARGTGTILVIEDEDVVVEVTLVMLEMLGYRVMTAKTGRDAVHIAETFDGPIDLALLDIKLLDIDGRNLYPLIMKARSNLKVIVFSGYSIDGPAQEILNAGAQDFIQKPFSLATLSEKLKKVLEVNRRQNPL